MSDKKEIVNNDDGDIDDGNDGDDSDVGDGGEEVGGKVVEVEL